MPAILDWPTLVLNRSWLDIDSTTVKRALKTVRSERAQIICTDDYSKHSYESWLDLGPKPGTPSIRTAHGYIRYPEVIVLTHYNRMPKRTVVFSRKNLWRRDKSRCQYCGVKPPPDEITIDHVLPKSRGGTTCWENTVIACIKCNLKKRNKTPEESGMRLRRYTDQNGISVPIYYDRPTAPRWSPLYRIRKHRPPDSWQNFVSDMYWNTELEN